MSMWSQQARVWALVSMVCINASTAGNSDSALQNQACTRLVFTHIGPQDAAVPVVSVAVGETSNSRGMMLLVAPEIYAAIRTQLFSGQALISTSPMPFGTFELDALECPQAAQRRRVGPEAFLEVLARVKRGLSDGKGLPESVARLETMVRRLSGPKAR